MSKKTTKQTKEETMNRESTLTGEEKSLIGVYRDYLESIPDDTEVENAAKRLQDAYINEGVEVVGTRKQDKAEAENRKVQLLAEISELARVGDFDGVVQRTAEMVSLTSLQSIKNDGVSGKFIAKKHFVVNASDNAPVKISCLGDNFKEWFLKGEGKVEEKSNGTIFRHFDLKKPMLDDPIIKKFGGKEKVAVALPDVFALMAKQPNGENGELLTNGYANIFYVYDQSGDLRAVHVDWSGGGWAVRAHSVGNPRGWHAGARAFSPNS